MSEIDDAIKALFSLIPPTKVSKELMHARWSLGPKYLSALELQPEVLGRLNVIHVTGTKGKGSTTSMTERILRRCGYSTGLYTSPHLCDVRERIRINGEKIPERQFADHINWCLSKLNQTDLPKTGFFQFMTYVAYRAFLFAKVDVVILEVGIGGTRDSTNNVQNTMVCGVSAIGWDHMDSLGYTLHEIATAKSGIFKPGAVAITVPQLDEPLNTLRRAAQSIGIPLIEISQYPFSNIHEIGNPNLETSFQKENACLAIHLSMKFEELFAQKMSLANPRVKNFGSGVVPEEYLDALRDFEFSGRAQTIRDEAADNLTFYVDGAHTPESIKACLDWFDNRAKQGPQSRRLLFFNCQEHKSAADLVESLGEFPFSHAFFVKPYSSKVVSDGTTNHQRSLMETYNERRSPSNRTDLSSHFSDTGADVMGSLSEAITSIRRFARDNRKLDIKLLVTGSLYLAGDVLKFLGRCPK